MKGKKYEMIGGPLHGTTRLIDMTIKGREVNTWNFWTGSDLLSTYRKPKSGYSDRRKTTHRSLLFEKTVTKKMTNEH